MKRYAMDDNLAADHAWSQCKGQLEPHTWSIGESATYYGFFLNGWHARVAWDSHKASECQRLADEAGRLQAENEALTEALAAMQLAVRMATLDLIFALDQLATTPIDAERTAGTLRQGKARLMYALDLPPNA